MSADTPDDDGIGSARGTAEPPRRAGRLTATAAA